MGQRWVYEVAPCDPPEQFYFGPLLDWSTARDLGRLVYFTGAPCKHGHIAERWVANRSCAECMRQRQRSDGHRQRVAYRRVTEPEFAERERARHKAEYENLRTNPDWMAKRADYSKRYRAERNAA